jgi:hypothetical protein
VLWFGQSGIFEGADLSGIKASSEEKTKLLIELCEFFSFNIKELAGKSLVFSCTASELKDIKIDNICIKRTKCMLCMNIKDGNNDSINCISAS